MGALMRTHEWSRSPLGHPAGWPDTLKAAIATCLASRFPTAVWWGPDLIMLYNDAWQPILGETKHPYGLGRPGAKSWPETWSLVRQQFEDALNGRASWRENLLLASDRHGFLEECYFTYSHSPLRDAEGKVVGVQTVVVETTDRVLSERRMLVLRDFAKATVEAASQSKSVEHSCEALLDLLCNGNPDIPFAAQYISENATNARLICAAGIDRSLLPTTPNAQERDAWGISRVLREHTPAFLEHAQGIPHPLPGGVWPEPTRQLVVLPLPRKGAANDLVGVLLVGLNSRLRLDQPYKDFLNFIAAELADFIERHRAEEALRQSEERYKGIYENAGTGIYIADLSGRFKYCNPAYASMHGYTEEELRKLRTKDLVHPEDWPRHTPKIQLLTLGKIRSFEIMNRCVSKGGDLLWVHKHVSLLRDAEGHPESTIALVTDMSERKRAEDARELLNAELDHRVKNALATVSAVVSHTQQGSRSVANFVAALKGRLRTMATTHELLSACRWQGISLTELVRREVAPYASSNNTQINGAEVVLEPEAGMAMAMVLHELATNAAKYGALSNKNGRVSIWWEPRLSAEPPDLVLEWREFGGPPVAAPDKSSFGMSTIRELIPYEFGGRVELTLAPEGAHCRVELPAHWLSSSCATTPEVNTHAYPSAPTNHALFKLLAPPINPYERDWLA
jgi:PAS domain S-box-containing protein